jgi:hypothetical protein
MIRDYARYALRYRGMGPVLRYSNMKKLNAGQDILLRMKLRAIRNSLLNKKGCPLSRQPLIIFP